MGTFFFRLTLYFFLSLLLFFFLEKHAEAAVTLLPSLTISEEYNDNFFFTGPEKEEEWTTVIAPAFTLRYQNPSVILSANYRGGIRMELKHDETNEYFQRLNFNIDLPFLSRTFNGVDVHITEAFENTPQTPAIPLGGERPVGETFITPVGPVETSRNAASIGLGYDWSRRFRTDFTYLNTILQYKGGLLEDFIAHNADILGTYNILRTTKLTVAYGVLITRFERSDGFTEHRITIGGSHNITPTFLITGSIGESLLPENKTVLSATFDLTKKIERSDIKIAYVRRVTTGEGVIAAAALDQTISVDVGYAITTRTLFASRIYHTQTNGLLGPSIETASNTNGLTAIATTVFLPWLTGSASYGYLDFKEQGGLNRNLNSNRISLFLTASDAGLRLMK
jgi:hypothetical protein